MIEVELRGFLPKIQDKKLKAFLDASSDKHDSYDEVAMFFDTANIPSLGSFYSGIGRIQANQKKYKNGTIQQKIKIKLNEPSGDGRLEYELILANNGIEGFFEMMKRFGVTKATFKHCVRHDYTVQGIEVSLKYGHPLGDHFEVEIPCKTEKAKKAALAKLNKFITDFGLNAWSQDDYKQIIKDNSYKTPYISFDAGMQLLK